MRDPDQDDLDDLFALLPTPAAPTDVGGRARARLRAIRGARRLTAVALVDLAVLVSLAVLAFLLGAAVSASDAPDIVRLAAEDRTLAIEARGDLARAFAESVPWLHIAAVALDALALCWVTAYLLRATDVAMPDGGTAG